MPLATALLATSLVALASARVQELGSSDLVSPRTRQYVSYQVEPQTIAAGKRSLLQLHFRVLDGFHVNSHTPRSDLLLATIVEVSPDAGAKISEAQYPSGSAYSFTFDPAEKLDVYQGPFTVLLPVVATAGAHEVQGTLKYQACDRTACYPPRSLPILMNFVAK